MTSSDPDVIRRVLVTPIEQCHIWPQGGGGEREGWWRRDQSDAFRSAVERGDGEKRGAGEYAPTFDIKRPTEKWIL